MKAIIILLLVNCVYVTAQIGVNTDLPKALFHIDAAANNTASSGSEDDVVFTTEGNIGIGNTAPDTKMSIKTKGTSSAVIKGFRLKNGTQANGLLLTSDASGIASWQTLPAFRSPINAVVGGGIDIALSSAANNYYNTGTYIDLAPGKWMLNIVMLLPDSGGTLGKMYFFKSTLSDSSSALAPSADIESDNTTVSGTGFAARHSLLIGNIILHNKTTATKRYYYVGGRVENGADVNITLSKFGGTPWNENNITAFLIQN